MVFFVGDHGISEPLLLLYNPLVRLATVTMKDPLLVPLSLLLTLFLGRHDCYPVKKWWPVVAPSAARSLTAHFCRRTTRPEASARVVVATPLSATTASSSGDSNRDIRDDVNVDHDHDHDDHDNSIVSFHRGNLTVLDSTQQHYIVVEKTPAVVCHHSEWTGSRSRQEVPMLQRVREAMHGRHVNLIHRLDRGCSGCLLLTFANKNNRSGTNGSSDADSSGIIDATSLLNEAMQAPTTIKTYLALVRGEGILHDRDFRKEGWFTVDRPITNERGNMADATTLFRFVAGQDNQRGTIDRPRASIVLARPATGRWHQIRKHLNGLSHPILGDSTHGNSKVNREFKQRYGLLPERTCLHLARIDMEPTTPPLSGRPNGIHVQCPLAPDMLQMLQEHMPDLLEEARPILEQEGVLVEPKSPPVILPYQDGTMSQLKYTSGNLQTPNW